MKPRVAIWIQGGIGNGDFSQGYPMLDRIVQRLSQRFDITVFSHTPPNLGYKPQGFSIVHPPRSNTSGKLRWLTLFRLYVGENMKRKFNLAFAFWGYPAGFIVTVLGILFRIPSVTCLMGADAASVKSVDYGIFHKRLPAWISRWTYHRTSALLCISEYQKRMLANFGIRRDPKVIQWGVDLSEYNFTRRRNPGLLSVIHVGHVNPVKDQVTMLRAFAAICQKTPATLKWFGLDHQRDEMRQLATELNIEKHVQFMGMVPYTDMPLHYQQADVMLHTSLSEGQCMALTEAAAARVLVAGTAVGVLADLGRECAIVIQSGDFEGLATQVLELWDKPEAWKLKLDNAFTWSKAHTFEWTLAQITAVVQDLLANGRLTLASLNEANVKVPASRS
jgi:glycosyltransferase involved in cell wall biosynthesis